MTATLTGHGVEIGTIFDCAWGYDQTNIDFYEVVGVTKTGVRIRKIGQTLAADGRHVLPVPGHYIGAAMFRKVHPVSYYGSWINLTSYSGASPWDGRGRYDTVAAGDCGH